jgi:hypothetical protein
MWNFASKISDLQQEIIVLAINKKTRLIEGTLILKLAIVKRLKVKNKFQKNRNCQKICQRNCQKIEGKGWKGQLKSNIGS